MPPERNSTTDRDDPRNCNPLYKSLPAEVITRRSDKPGKKAPAEPVKVQVPDADLDKVLEKKADGRAKWLAKAVVQAAEGRLDVKSLYAVVAHKRFVNDLTDKAGKKMYRALVANLHIFSSKQRKFLEKDSALAREYAASAFMGMKDGEGTDDQTAKTSEAMMERIRGFVREKESEREPDEEMEETKGAGEASKDEAEDAKAKESAEAPAEAKEPPAGGRASRSRSGSDEKDKKRSRSSRNEKDKKEEKKKRSKSKSGKDRKKSSSSSPSRKRSRSRSKSRGRRPSAKRSKAKKRQSSSSGRRKSKKSKRKASTSSSSTDRKKKKKR